LPVSTDFLYTFFMPELPEVETVVKGLQSFIVGQHIVKAQLLTKQLSRINSKDFSKVLPGKTIEGVGRKGKQIIIDLSNDWVLWIHLMMTGKLWLLGLDEPQTKFDGALFELEPLGKKLVFYDQRRFGKVKLLKSGELSKLKEYSQLGPDGLEVSKEDFIGRVKNRSRMLKPLLTDQSVISGLGNIYVDESLFVAKIHPQAVSSRLSRQKLEELFDAVRKVLKRAIRAGGSSIRDYSGVDGQRGYFQVEHKVYQKAGKPCPVCRTKIKRIILAQRSSHFCPKCQKR